MNPEEPARDGRPTTPATIAAHIAMGNPETRLTKLEERLDALFTLIDDDGQAHQRNQADLLDLRAELAAIAADLGRHTERINALERIASPAHRDAVARASNPKPETRNQKAAAK